MSAGNGAATIREIRLTRNQALFRQVNERVEKAADAYRADGPISFVCECSDTDCMRQIPLTREEYERVREVPTRFAIAPGHEIPDIERVVEQSSRYFMVEKVEASGVLAAETDPRRGPHPGERLP
jgi:hypothetical protein